jgi:hypothetical protein
MLYNVNCQKKSQMLKPGDLFELPQDNINKNVIPKSTYEQMKEFEEKVNKKFNK